MSPHRNSIHLLRIHISTTFLHPKTQLVRMAMRYGTVERRHCDWTSPDDTQAFARLFADSSRHRSPLLLTGFAAALGWSVAVERWRDPEYLRVMFDGVPRHLSGVTLSSRRYSHAEKRLATDADEDEDEDEDAASTDVSTVRSSLERAGETAPAAVQAEKAGLGGGHATPAWEQSARTASFAPGKFAPAHAHAPGGEHIEETCSWADGVDRVFRRASVDSFTRVDAKTTDAAGADAGADARLPAAPARGVYNRGEVEDTPPQPRVECTPGEDVPEEGEKEGAEERCCYMKSDMRPRLRADLLRFPDAAFFPSPPQRWRSSGDGSRTHSPSSPPPQVPPPLRTSGRLHSSATAAAAAAEGFKDKLAKVWVGQAGACTSLHFDLCHGGERERARCAHAAASLELHQ